MPISPSHLFARPFPVIDHAFSQRDAQLYALGVGVGADPLDARQLRYVYEGKDRQSLRAMPTMANVLAYPGFWAREPDTGITWQKLLHAEQEIHIHAPLPTFGRVKGATRITGLWDKGEGKGAFLQQTREITNAETGQSLATVVQLNLLRGDGGFGEGGSPGAPPAPHAMPEGEPDYVYETATPVQLALIYRLSGDLNPLHADPLVAAAAGFPRPILHGMALMGVAAHAVLRTVLAYDDERFAGMRVRFTAAAWPGETLRTKMWVRGRTVSLCVTAVERGVVVLNNARVDLR
ncbi:MULTISPECIES: MaoC/PaaZ C-terminal domain-containing protein [unclassified Caballeronia]|uniref:MaoC/PaaZ C-terminal domain-containing protein n=1 Tax=unclassified Caballeronia TaxID=2646786 RepID=UPI002865C74E|nr:MULTISPECIES: MaoC/PaaZ C-terminal domain-containing protein [unclassified Caballeronia]MDR5752400.1 MaoC/PaaZ C-terminal domain-containing protein [Caballeronia sp. LZ024]MDR5845206.1 MaoC/PaaZ C-terminal domain-containing protein [Caballeronia sp. LZ031]